MWGGQEAVRLRVQILERVHPAVLLLIVAVLAYGLLLPHLGFYWDELPMSWIRYELGPQAMTRYFSTNRPVWGMLYQLTTRLLPQIPIYWEVFGLFWRWVSALLLWGIVRNLWPRHREFAVTASLCFLLYPGFNQQWTSYLYSHFFIVLCFLLSSFLCTLASVRLARWYWPVTAAGMVLSGLNLWMMEYFFVLELFRPFMILEVVSSIEPAENLRARAGRALRVWAPYLLVLIANILWRLLVFNNQIYQPTLMPRLRAAPFTTVLDLIRAVLSSFYTVSVGAWIQIFQVPNPVLAGPRTLGFYAAVVLMSALVIGLFMRATHADDDRKMPVGWSPIGLGVVAMLTAGGPFWLTGLEVSTAYPANRFTLPFMLGVSLLLAGLLQLISPKVRPWFVVGLISLAAGRQALWSDAFRRDWATQKSMFWQMLWRAPGLVPHTIVLLNEGPLPYYADNSLTGALNWIYDPDNRSGSMEYVLFYPTSRLGGTLQDLQPGQPITYDFISEVFTGNTSQTIAIYYEPPGCLRLLDPLIDPGNHLISDTSMMRDAAKLSSSSWILPQASARMPQIYGPEPTHNWCYYFETAELAGQVQDWAQVVTLGDQAFSLSDYPNSPVERFVFVEGYAHQGQWDRAVELSNVSYKVSRAYVGPLLCQLWRRIELATANSPQRAAALSEVKTMFACSSE
jgi:hypothetical protein